MSTLNEFRDGILDEVHFNASMNGTSPREEFLTLYANALADAEELEDFEIKVFGFDDEFDFLPRKFKFLKIIDRYVAATLKFEI